MITILTDCKIKKKTNTAHKKQFGLTFYNTRIVRAMIAIPTMTPKRER
jgi:hypothetical protein